MVFIETPAFRRSAAELLDDDDLAALQTKLMLRPLSGVVIPGSSGLRKVRVPARGKGTRGGARVIYYFLQSDGQIFLLFAYAKSQRDDLTKEQAKLLRSLID